MMTHTTEIDRETIDTAAQMIRHWNASEVLGTLSMGEGFALAALLDALDEHETAAHIIREVWKGEGEDSRDPLPWVNGHGSRISDRDYAARADELARDEGDERFLFAPRPALPDEPDAIEQNARGER